MTPVQGGPMKPSWSHYPWRVGRKAGRTIYAMKGNRPSDDDVLIGMLDTPELAKAAVEAHNHWKPAWPIQHPEGSE